MCSRHFLSSCNTKTILFLNADLDKPDLIKTDKNKSGVYMWKNNLNGKRYVGSTINLRRRFLEYYNSKVLLRNSDMVICSALLKYGYSSALLKFRDTWSM